MKFSPYANESDALTLGDLNAENRMDRVSLYGTLAITKDKVGLAAARQLHDLLGQIVQVLESDRNLEDKMAEAEPTKTVKNPFA